MRLIFPSTCWYPESGSWTAIVTCMKARRNKLEFQEHTQVTFHYLKLASSIMSSFSSSLYDVSKDYRKVRVAANLGALFSFPGVSFPSYDVPQITLPFPVQPLDAGTPLQFYQDPATLYIPIVSNTQTTQTDNNLYYPNYSPSSLISSREATPSSTTSTVGPIRGSTTTSKRPKPYTRPSASSSSQLSIPASEHASSSIAQSRLAVVGICKINGCGQTFTSADVYLDHVRNFHDVRKGKNGKETINCPWDGCGEEKTKASLWNHILGHNTKSACYICHRVLKGTRSDTMKRHIKGCSSKLQMDEVISSTENLGNSGAYIFFCEEE